MLAEQYGWRTGFYCFGAAGIVLALLLYVFLREPARVESPSGKAAPSLPDGVVAGAAAPPKFLATLLFLLRHPSARLLLLAFVGANFVAALFLFPSRWERRHRWQRLPLSSKAMC